MMPDSPDLDKGAAHLEKAHAFRCEHGQLGRTCLLCEMRYEILTLKREGLEALQEWAETETELQAEIEALRAKLADCQAVIRDRGHGGECPAAYCERCLRHVLHHPTKLCAGFTPGHCSDDCGHDRTTGEKA